MTRAIVDWAVLAVSFYNTISLLWLGWMVLLTGNRRSPGVWLTGSGLLLGALFFTSHTAILGSGLRNTGLGMDFWWAMSWMPAVFAPLAWYGAMLWYTGYRLTRLHSHHAWVGLVGLLACAIGLLLVFANPLPTYKYVTGRMLLLTPSIAGIPLLILVYVGYSLLCYLLPLDLLRRESGNDALETRMRQRARPWLVAASVALLLAGIGLAWTAFWAISTRPVPSLNDPDAEQTVKLFDLAVSGLVALAITLLGRAIVRYEVFTGRPMPRDRLFRQWRSTVFLAAGFGAVSGWTLAIGLRPIYGLMLATTLMTLFYALYAWRTSTEREQFMDRLRPFIASQDLYGKLAAPRPGQAAQPDSSASTLTLFRTLCLEVLEVQQAVLVPAGALATLAGPPLVFPEESETTLPPLSQHATRFTRQVRCLSAAQIGSGAGIDWAVPLWSSRGLDGVLYLKEKTSRNPLSEEEIEIAQTAGERLLDLLAGAEMARLAMDLLGQRLAQARVMDGQGRRVLHDEVLPELHTALLYMSEDPPADKERNLAIDALVRAHRRLAGLMREIPVLAPHHLAQSGLVAALQSMLEADFAGQFFSVSLAIQPEAAQRAREIPLFINEALFFAARELIRNASSHGRGEEQNRNLCLWVNFTLQDGLHLVIEDNGIGYDPEREATPESDRGGGNGLRIHSAILAAVGASLEVTGRPEGGTRAVITVYS